MFHPLLKPYILGIFFHCGITESEYFLQLIWPGQHNLELAALRRELTREATEVSEGLEETNAEDSEASTVQMRQGGWRRRSRDRGNSQWQIIANDSKWLMDVNGCKRYI